MWKKGKTLAACMLAAAWWSVFYPELCFTEETCEAVQMTKPEETDGRPAAEPSGDGQFATARNGESYAVSDILKADDDEIVISSRLLEWCGEKLPDPKK